jgi:hypothetical protein
LLVEAIRYGDQPDVRARLTRAGRLQRVRPKRAARADGGTRARP